ncbi:MAG TPA: hypothetical protein VF290_10395 [Pyrinomonadaceae bacterium]
MKDQHRFIFREKAMRHYARGRNRAVLSQIAIPRLTALLWVFVAVLLCGGLFAWLVRIPVYVSGVGVVVEPVTRNTGDNGQGAVLAVFLPEAERSKIHVGQRLFWSFDNKGKRVSSNLVAVETEVSSPMAVQSRFHLAGAAATAITKPVVVGFGSLDQVPGNLPMSAYLGSVHRVDIEIGNTRAISLVPFLNRVSGD